MDQLKYYFKTIFLKKALLANLFMVFIVYQDP